MKRPCAIIFPLVLLCLWIAGCTPASTREALARAVSIMVTAPDSALAILDALDPATLNSDGTRARYALLRSQALDKNYIDVTDDSLISIASDYYATSSDARSRMLSLYYHGRVHYNAADYPHALVMFTRSLDEARALDDPFWCGRNADQISSVYNKTERRADELRYSIAAEEYFRLSERIDFYSYSLLDLAKAHLNNDNDTLAIQYALQAKKAGKRIADYSLVTKSENLYAIASFYTGNYMTAINILEAELQTENPVNLCSSVGHLGMAYLDAGHMDKAELLYGAYKETPHPAILTLGYKLAEAKKDYKKATTIRENLLHLSDSIFGQALTENFDRAFKDRQKYDDDIRLTKERHARILRKVLILIAVSVLSIICFFAFKTYRKQKKQIKRNIEIADNLKEILTLKESEMTKAKESINSLMNERFSEIDNWCQICYESKAANNSEEKLSNLVESFIDDMSSRDEGVARLYEIANKNYNNVMERLHQALPGMKKADYLLFLYTLLGFSTSAIALFLREDKIDSVYNRKARLKRKLKTLDTDASSEFIGILG